MSRLIDMMLMRNMADRDRRAVMIGLAVLLPALLWIVAVRPYRAALGDLRTRLETERSLLLREEALLAQGRTMPGMMAATSERAQRAALRLVRASNVPLAEAELTAYLEEIAGLSRVLLQEMRGVERRRGEPDFSDRSVRPLRLSVRGESDLEGVLTFLQRIEQNPVLLKISELSIEPQFEGSDDERMPTGVVQFTLIVEAYAPADAEQVTDPGEVSP